MIGATGCGLKPCDRLRMLADLPSIRWVYYYGKNLAGC